MNEPDPRWHKGSRFWRVGALVAVLAWLLVPVAVRWSPDSVSEAMGVFGGLATVLLGGGAAANWRERGP